MAGVANGFLAKLLTWLLTWVDVSVEIIDGKLHVMLRVGEWTVLDLAFELPRSGQKQTARAR